MSQLFHPAANSIARISIVVGALAVGLGLFLVVVVLPRSSYVTQLSPDGRWSTWLSDESGQPEVYLSDFPEAKQKWQVSKGGVARNTARWAPKGDAVYYRTSEGIVRVTVSVEGDDLELGASEVAVELDPSTFRGAFFLLPDAQLLTLKNVTEGGVEPLRIIRN